MLLTSIISLPLFGALLVGLIPREIRFGIRLVALGATFVTMLLALLLFFSFQTGQAGYQFELSVPWVQSIGINFHVGVKIDTDGLDPRDTQFKLVTGLSGLKGKKQEQRQQHCHEGGTERNQPNAKPNLARN